MGHDSCIWDMTFVYGTWLVYMGHDLFREQEKKRDHRSNEKIFSLPQSAATRKKQQ